MVGAGNSGAEIAIELAPHHKTWLSGPDTGQEPARAGSHLDHLITPLMWFVATRLTVKTALGRKLRDHFIDPPRGIPLGRVRRKDFAPAGIERVPRMTGVRNGYPVLENGRVLEVSNVIWCTGYAPDYDWIDLSLPNPQWPSHSRSGHRRVLSRSLLRRAPLPLLAELGAVGRCGTRCQAHRRPHRFNAARKNGVAERVIVSEGVSRTRVALFLLMRRLPRNLQHRPSGHWLALGMANGHDSHSAQCFRAIATTTPCSKLSPWESTNRSDALTTSRSRRIRASSLACATMPASGVLWTYPHKKLAADGA